MAEFVARTTAPDESNSYYYTENPFYQSGYGLPNCTAYAWGRFYELSGAYPALSLGNAENWYSYADGYNRGKTAKLGAVIVWAAGAVGDASDGAGHVAIVEQINADGSIVTSNSAYGGSLFYMQEIGSDYALAGYTFLGFIYNPVDFGAVATIPGRIWNFLKIKLGNEYGAAGLMGNLEAESGLCPYIVQGDVPVSSYSEAYTANVDSGAISEYDFVYNGPGGGGYGLAQWTYWSRKQALYDMWESGGYDSIGSLELALDYLWEELQTLFPGVLAVLKSASSVREASDSVLHDFEAPADQSESVEEYRESLGLKWYEKYAGTWGDDESQAPKTSKRRTGYKFVIFGKKPWR